MKHSPLGTNWENEPKRTNYNNTSMEEIKEILREKGYSWEEIGDILYELSRLIPTPWAQREIFDDPRSDAAMRRGLSPVQFYLAKLKGEI